MYYRKNSEANVCRTYEAKTPSPKSWCVASYLRMASDLGFIVKTCRESLTLFFRNTKPSFSSTAAFGTVIPVVSMLLSQKPTASFGKPKFPEILNEISKLILGSLNQGGGLLKYGSANLNQRQKTEHFKIC